MGQKWANLTCTMIQTWSQKGPRNFPTWLDVGAGGLGVSGVRKRVCWERVLSFLFGKCSAPRPAKSEPARENAVRGTPLFVRIRARRSPFVADFCFWFPPGHAKPPFQNNRVLGSNLLSSLNGVFFQIAFDPGLGASDPLQQLFCVRRVSSKSEPRARVRGRGSPPVLEERYRED